MDIQKLSEKLLQISQKYVKTNNIEVSKDRYLLKLQEEIGELTQKYLMLSGQARQKGFLKEEIQNQFEEEFADVFGHILLFAKYFEIDIESAIQRKRLKYYEEPKS